MSSPHTPSPGGSSPSSRSSNPASNLDTTPSPSGGNKPSLNAHTLSSKLALIEASQSLAHAVEVLGIAATAMAKAATSLARACSDQGNEYSLENTGAAKIYVGDNHDPYLDWRNSSYTLPLPNTASNYENDEYADEPDEGYVPQPSSSSPDPGSHSNLTQIQPATPSSLGLGRRSGTSDSTHPSHGHLPELSVTSPQSLPIEHQSLPSSSTSAEIPQLVDLIRPPSTSRDAWDQAESTLAPSKAITEPTPELANETATIQLIPNQLVSTNVPGPNVPSPRHTRLVLDRGFDSLPALCEIIKRREKTIYFHRMTNSFYSIGSMLKDTIDKTVIIPSAFKPEHLHGAARRFSSASSAVLVWPGNIPLMEMPGLESSRDTQVIFLGQPPKETAAILCPRVTVIIAKSELANPKLLADTSTNSKYASDQATNLYNMQGGDSVLHDMRVRIRSRLANDSFARSLYWGWIMYSRKENPAWTALQLVQCANQYANEFLLRGDSQKYGEPVGALVSISRNEANAQKLQPAVQAGILSVY